MRTPALTVAPGLAANVSPASGPLTALVLAAAPAHPAGPSIASLPCGETTLLGHLLREVVSQAGCVVAVLAPGQPKPRLSADVAGRVRWVESPAGAVPPRLRGAGSQVPPDARHVALIGAVRLGVGDALRQLSQALDAHPESPGAAQAAPHPAAVLGVYRLPALWQAAEAWERGDPAALEGLARILPACAEGACGDPAAPVLTLEDYRAALVRLGLCRAAHPAVDLELFGSLRMVGGCAVLPLRADRIATAVECLRRVQPALERLLPPLAALAETHRFAINGGAITTDLRAPLRPGDRLAMFSASVGG